MSQSHSHSPATHHKHPYHLVDPSPWPVGGAISAATLAAGLLLYMRSVTPWLLPLGFVMVLGTMFGWWRDVIREATFEGHHNAVVQIGMRYGMILFIASEVMFFSAFFWAFF